MKAAKLMNTNYYKLLYKGPTTKLEYTRKIRNINEILHRNI